ncbi:MAG TPA: RNA polymerase sigma-70 factor [Acidimicrobiales bacterium]|nr:RNA polymerase sigma-70 factor [Acidimicrobiales bacterium]
MGDLETFLGLRRSLFAVAYRMLGSATEAEDVVQEAYVRWSGRGQGEVTAPTAYLTTVVTRLCIDHLRSARARRETYKGPWLPEPVEAGAPPPGESAELADSLSLAFLVLLEELQPVERAAFLLHDVFDYPYDEIAAIVDRTEPACRQLVSRARRRVDAPKHRFDADRAHGRELTRRFLAACGSGDLDGLLSLLADDVTVWTDGGGKVRAALRPVTGPPRAARFLLSVARRIPAGVAAREVDLNGQPGLVFEDGDEQVTVALTLDVVDDRIVDVRVVTNPDKLLALQPGRRPHLSELFAP